MPYFSNVSRFHRTARTLSVIFLLIMSACGSGREEEETANQETPPAAAAAVTVEAAEAAEAVEAVEAADDRPAEPTVDRTLPEGLASFLEPWSGDFDGMIDRRIIRALIPYGGYQFYFDDGRPRGATYDMLMAFERFVNSELGLKNVKVYVLPVPVSRDQMIPSLLAGRGDLIAADLTPTTDRLALLDFTRPLLRDIEEVIVQNSAAEPLASIDDISGREIFIRRSSSYFEHLSSLAGEFKERQLEPPIIVVADEILEAEDIIEMISLGEVELTVMDDYKAEFWAGVLPNVEVRNDLAISPVGSIAWAHRKDSPLLAKQLEDFLRKFGRGSLFGNDTYQRYLAQAARSRCATSVTASGNMEVIIDLFRKYGDEYSINWLRLAAQAYQESGLNQNRVSPAGAVGIMQIKPSTAADKHIRIDDVSTLDTNIHAGTKYLRFVADRYFSGDEINELDQWLLSLAAYNAGPAKIARIRREAEENGYDPAIWFDNVEIIAAKRIGRETVTYVSNIFKYYISYQIAWDRVQTRGARFGDVLTACNDS
jgi:membrane-bound lytic murein transglycosylase MltF